MLNINIITLFPNLIEPHLKELPFKKAISNKSIKFNLVNLRNYALDDYGTVDGKPYGGGVGMILRIEPIYNALLDIHPNLNQSTFDKNKNPIILLSPKGKQFKQSTAKDLTKKDSITFISGRYEGIDARVEEYCTDIISIGDYVLSGGELPSLVICESITRLLPGVIEDSDAIVHETFENNYLEHPQYTRPFEFKDKKVPEILISGDHKKIEQWKKDNSVKINDVN